MIKQKRGNVKKWRIKLEEVLGNFYHEKGSVMKGIDKLERYLKLSAILKTGQM
jgi:hypothetical protein